MKTSPEADALIDEYGLSSLIDMIKEGNFWAEQAALSILDPDGFTAARSVKDVYRTWMNGAPQPIAKLAGQLYALAEMGGEVAAKARSEQLDECWRLMNDEDVEKCEECDFTFFYDDADEFTTSRDDPDATIRMCPHCHAEL